MPAQPRASLVEGEEAEDRHAERAEWTMSPHGKGNGLAVDDVENKILDLLG